MSVVSLIFSFEVFLSIQLEVSCFLVMVVTDLCCGLSFISLRYRKVEQMFVYAFECQFQDLAFSGENKMKGHTQKLVPDKYTLQFLDHLACGIHVVVELGGSVV